MADATLVKAEVDCGRELIGLLDKAKFPVTGAAWVHFPNIEEWRLIIRSPKAATNLQEAYLEIAKIMDASGDLRQRLDLARVKLVPPSDRLLAAIGSIMRVEGLNTITFRKNVINGLYIDDAVIYRLAA